MHKTAIVVLADGFEEIEAIAPVDILRRADIEVSIVGLTGLDVTSVRNVRVMVDALLSDVNVLPDAIVLPGGMPGSKHLGDSAKLQDFTQCMFNAGKLCAAICAAPVLTLGAWGLLSRKRATCFPGMENSFPSDVVFSTDSVVLDGNIITSRGAGTALEFGFEIVKYLQSHKIASELRERMVAK